jgi:hypothetical protein
VSKRLIAQIKGGIGNQLFCYASARRLALTNDAELVLDAISGFSADHLYKRQYSLDIFHIDAPKATPWQRMEPFGRLRRGVKRRLNKMLPLSRKRYIFQEGVQFDPEILSLRLQKGDTYFDGFGQSEDYFSDIESILRKDLVFKSPLDDQNQKVFTAIKSSNSVAIHVRWFNPGNQDSSDHLALQYYQDTISRMIAAVANPHFFVFSDQMSVTKQHLEPLLSQHSVTYVEHNNSERMAYTDLWLMSQCQHFIIANSTFSWWGAWLGEKKNISQIYAPGKYVNPNQSVTAWGFDRLIPDRWITL